MCGGVVHGLWARAFVEVQAKYRGFLDSLCSLGMTLVKWSAFRLADTLQDLLPCRICADIDLRLNLSHIYIDIRLILSYIQNIVIYSRNQQLLLCGLGKFGSS
jgi:hypothetical protein